MKSKFSLFAVLIAALGLIAWTSAGDVKITGSLISKIQQFYGATGTNFIKLPDNLATALTVEDYENGGDLITIATTNSSELISVVKPLAATSTLAVTGASTFASTVGITGALAVTGAVTLQSTLNVAGAVTFTAPNLTSVASAVGATGSLKTDCTAITKEFNTITGTALQGVCLLTAAIGQHQIVYNDSTVSLVVYPLDAGNDTLAVNDLAALTADTGYVVGPKGLLDCTAYTTTAWQCNYTMGARAVVAAAGTNQGTGTALASVNVGSYVAVTGADATKAITLPSVGSASTYVPGCISVHSTVNTNTAYLSVFGNTSDNDTINGAAADAVYTMGAGATVTFCSIDGVAWLTQ